MSNLFYKNPLTPVQVSSTYTVGRNKPFGTNFSVLGIGGYMEVFNLSNLAFTIPVGQTGNIEISANTIPIHFKKGTGSAFSFDVLTLNSDNISSGRRRLGMLVYVYETNKIYQYTIENYDTLWSAATGATGPGGSTVVISDFGTTVKNNTIAGQNFINSWTASTIEGVSGYTNLNATWRELVTGSGGTSSADTFVTGFTLSSNTITLTQNRTDQYSSFTISLSAYTGSSSTSGAFLPLSGGTVTGNTIFQSGLTASTLNVTGNTLLSGLTATTISATTYQNLPVTADTFVTGFTLSSNTLTLTQNRTDGYSSFTISLSAYTGSSSTLGAYLPLSGGTVTGNTIFNSGLTANTLTVTGNTLLSGLTAVTISATTYQNLPVTADTFVTGFTLTANTITLTQNRTDQYSSFTISLSAYTGSSSTSGAYLPLSGGTVTGNTIFQSGLTANTLNVTGNTLLSGLTAATISATTYQNVNAVTGGSYSNGSIILSGTGNFASSISGFPTTFINDYLPLSGGTVSGGTIFQSGLTANTLNVTGNALLSGLTAATISATTYFNLPTDIRVTGGTYTNGTATFTNNTGGTFNVTGFAIGGGGGQIFYLNLSQSQNGNRFLSTTASTASEQTSGVTIGSSVTGSIASFQTTPLNISLIPGGIWSFYLHSYKQDNNSSFNIFVEVYKITSGGSQTLLFATDPAPVTTNSPNPSMQLTDGYFSGTSLNVSDGVVAVVKATNTDNQPHIITLVTEGSQHYSYVVSTIPTQQGLTCETLSGCSIIQTINTDISNKFDKSGGTVSGATNFISGLTANTISATTYLNYPDTYVTGFTLSSNTITLTQNRTDGYSSLTISLSAYTGTSISGLYLPLSGGTVTGGTVFQSGVTATTISATTYQNLPSQSGTGISAFAYNGSTGILTITKNDTTALTAGTFSYLTSTTLSAANVLSVASNGGSPTTTTINAVTGGTYSNGTITLSGTGSVNGIQITGLSTGGGGGLTWNNATASITATTNNGYVGTATTLTTITLPTSAAFGTTIEVVGTGTGLWRISQNSGQSIKFGVATTTTGTTGYLSATSQYDCVKLLCTSENTTFVVTSAIGNIFYI